MLEAILPAVACVAGIGLLCAVILVAAAKFMAVQENRLEKELRACLPGVNCGACGYAGCDSYAGALAGGTEKQTNLCIPGADAVSKQISKSLGVAFQNTVEQVAAVHCCGDCEHAVQKANYSGVQTCSGAKMLYGGRTVVLERAIALPFVPMTPFIWKRELPMCTHPNVWAVAYV